MKAIAAVSALLSLLVLWTPSMANPVPTWEKHIDTPARFKVLGAFDEAAVLDKETGLVWERSPSSALFDWKFAFYHCTTLAVGNRGGWRLPAIHELMSLVDPSAGGPPTLPANHPFTNIQTIVAPGESIIYWAATNSPFLTDETFAFEMNFVGGIGSPTTTGKSAQGHAWCVRGGTGIDPQN